MDASATEREAAATTTRRRRAKNLALAGALFALVVLFYLITVVKLTGNVS